MSTSASDARRVRSRLRAIRSSSTMRVRTGMAPMLAAHARFFKPLRPGNAGKGPQDPPVHRRVDARRAAVREPGGALLALQRHAAGLASPRELAHRLVPLGAAHPIDPGGRTALPPRAERLV